MGIDDISNSKNITRKLPSALNLTNDRRFKEQKQRELSERRHIHSINVPTYMLIEFPDNIPYSLEDVCFFLNSA